MLFTLTTMAAAQENWDTKEGSVVIINHPEVDPAILEQEAINSYLSKLNMPQTDYYEYKAESQGKQTNTKVPIGFAGNQPVGGTVFMSEGGFFWTDGGYDVSVSVSFEYEFISVSVAAGKSGTSGRYIKSPWINTKEALEAYVKRWRIEVFFRTAKQELGMQQCHSTMESHHHAHFQLLFAAETILSYALWEQNNEKRVMMKATPTAKWFVTSSTLVVRFV